MWFHLYGLGMTGLGYRVNKYGDCLTKCPFGEDRMVGSLACEACKSHFQKFGGIRHVICKREA